MSTISTSTLTPFVATLVSILISQSVSAEKCGSSLGNIFASNRNAVAVKVGGLSENNWVWGLEFSPDSELLVTAVLGRAGYQLWDWRKGKVVREFKATVPQNGKPPNALGNAFFNDQFTKDAMRFRADLPVFTTCHNSYGEDARGWIISTTWNSDTGQFIGNLHYPGTCSSVDYLPNKKLLLGVSGKLPARMILLDPNTHGVPELWRWESEKSQVKAVALSPDKKFAAVGSYDAVHTPAAPSPGGVEDVRVGAQVYILDLATGTVVRSFAPIPGDNEIDGLSWSGDGKHIAIGESRTFTYSRDTYSPLKGATVVVFDAQSGEIVAKEESEEHKVTMLRYTPDGRYLIEAGLRDSVEIWDSQHQKLLQEICEQPENGTLAGDGKKFAIVGRPPILGGTEITVWDLK